MCIPVAVELHSSVPSVAIGLDGYDESGNERDE